MPFVVFGLGLVWLMSVLPMTVWPLFLSLLGQDLNPVIIIIFSCYIAAFVLPGPAICFCGKMLHVSYHGYLSFDPFFTIAASLKAMQCVKGFS